MRPPKERKEKGLRAKSSKPSLLLGKMARRTGFEPVTFGSVVQCSIQLSYRRVFVFMAVRQGFEPWRELYGPLPA